LSWQEVEDLGFGNPHEFLVLEQQAVRHAEPSVLLVEAIELGQQEGFAVVVADGDGGDLVGGRGGSPP
jgi:hypothetical protein